MSGILKKCEPIFSTTLILDVSTVVGMVVWAESVVGKVLVLVIGTFSMNPVRLPSSVLLIMQNRLSPAKNALFTFSGSASTPN